MKRFSVVVALLLTAWALVGCVVLAGCEVTPGVTGKGTYKSTTDIEVQVGDPEPGGGEVVQPDPGAMPERGPLPVDRPLDVDGKALSDILGAARYNPNGHITAGRSYVERNAGHGEVFLVAANHPQISGRRNDTSRGREVVALLEDDHFKLDHRGQAGRIEAAESSGGGLCADRSGVRHHRNPSA